MDILVRGFGGEVPRAEGVGGGKPPPNTGSDTPDRGSADLGVVETEPLWNHWEIVLKTRR